MMTLVVVSLLALLSGETIAGSHTDRDPYLQEGSTEGSHTDRSTARRNPYIIEGNPDGCPASDLSFFCEFNQGLTGDLLFNKCRFYDPANRFNCNGHLGLDTVGWRCKFCCKKPNGRVPECSLNYNRQPIHAGDNTNIPQQDRLRRGASPRHCNGMAWGNLCNQASGTCNDYCCKEETTNPCITPICPSETSSGQERREINERVIRQQCQWWQQSIMSSGSRGVTLRRAEWNENNQQVTATSQRGPGRGRGNLERCPETHTTVNDRCCIGLASGGEWCYRRQPRG